MIQRHHASLLGLSFIVALGGCDGGDGDADASADGAAPLEMSALFGACEQDWQCPGEGAFCRTGIDGFPGGSCTIACEDRTPCDTRGVYHHCATREGETESFCERRCLNGLDCGRDGYTCAGSLPPSGGVCISVCSSDEECGTGAVCDRYTALCAAAVSTTGATNGEPCADNDACRSGQCLAEQGSDGTPTGWIGGYCVSNCILPTGFNNNDFFAGPALPNGGCPAGVCLPAVGGNNSVRDLGRCYVECVSDGDCRGGYTCLKDISLSSGGTSSYSNGLCVPANCEREGCPTGYTCQMVTDSGGRTRSVCGR